MERVENAAAVVRNRRGPMVDDQEQFMRYNELKQNPTKLFDFVARSLNTNDPEKLRNGTARYLSEMQSRFGS